MKLYRVNINYGEVEVSTQYKRTLMGAKKLMKILQADPCYSDPGAIWEIMSIEVKFWEWIKSEPV